MTVRELIETLEEVGNKEIRVVIDCPQCGKSNEVRSLAEVVTLGSKNNKGGTT